MVLRDLSPSPSFPIACIVTENYLFEFLILYESLIHCWTTFDIEIHAYTPDEETRRTIQRLSLPKVTVHTLDLPKSDAWSAGAAAKVLLVSNSNLERALVTDLDNLFLSETPELFALLEDHEYVFIGAPHSCQLLQTSLWGFKRSKRATDFSKTWFAESVRQGRHLADAEGLPYAILSTTKENMPSFRTLAYPIKAEQAHHPCPWDIQINIRPIAIEKDELGFFDRNMGRAKVIHFAGIRAEGSASASGRMHALAKRFPESKAVFPLYLTYANKAAKRLKRKTVLIPTAFLIYLSMFRYLYHTVYQSLPGPLKIFTKRKG